MLQNNCIFPALSKIGFEVDSVKHSDDLHQVWSPYITELRSHEGESGGWQDF